MDHSTRINNLVADFFATEGVTGETHLYDDLVADSLDKVEIAMMLEDEFDIEILDEEMEDVRTVADVYKILEANLK